ncbi:hypothetical protein [Rhodococcus triatomae]
MTLPDRRRIYADTPEDVIAVLIGGDYPDKLATLRYLEHQSTTKQSTRCGSR